MTVPSANLTVITRAPEKHDPGDRAHAWLRGAMLALAVLAAAAAVVSWDAGAQAQRGGAGCPAADGDGVSVCREIRSAMPQLACLMLTSFTDDEALFDAIMAGASGYVLKQIHGSDLAAAVRTLASGGSLLDPGAAARVMERMREQAHPAGPLAGLTGQEKQILELIGEGLTNPQIGQRLFLAEKTVKNYVSGLFAKLGMQRCTQAAAYATRVFPISAKRTPPGRPAAADG